MKQIITTENAPAPIGPYSQAVIAGDTLYISGQVAIVPATGDILTHNLEEEAHQVMKNLSAILKEAGFSFNEVVKTTIFLSSMDLFARVNDVYGSYFSETFPARETVAVSGLPKGVNVEISMIACHA